MLLVRVKQTHDPPLDLPGNLIEHRLSCCFVTTEWNSPGAAFVVLVLSIPLPAFLANEATARRSLGDAFSGSVHVSCDSQLEESGHDWTQKEATRRVQRRSVP